MAFETSKAILPKVKILEVDGVPDAGFLSRACPSLEAFSTYIPSKQWKRTFQAIARMTTIQWVRVENENGWTASQVRDLLKYVQKIPELSFVGTMKYTLADVTDLFSNTPNLAKITTCIEPWINPQKLRERAGMDRRYLRSLSYRQVRDGMIDKSPYSASSQDIARALFNACENLIAFASYRSGRDGVHTDKWNLETALVPTISQRSDVRAEIPRFYLDVNDCDWQSS
ncbi:hypothetical protein LTR84_006875 [Exophiala bonariae]|uniref:Uncharacterized protein n=1 Tax=Exophiala bonariae TaxID=1690606 RepID=A0AAV9N3X9_9EURO|nr:hypothetical protein LTR84_006875 [Exophiala bonariae]